MGRAATLGCRGDGVGTEALGSGRDLALPARAGWGRGKLGVPLSARSGTWGGWPGSVKVPVGAWGGPVRVRPNCGPEAWPHPSPGQDYGVTALR